jgi:uncharacterized protein
MTNYLNLIEKYYQPGSLRYKIYLPHCTAVKDLSLRIAKAQPELGADLVKIEWGAMLHDIGIFLTDAPELGCFGSLPYIVHGFKGRKLLEKEGLPEIAPVCERHIGVGITIKDIEERNLPLPRRDMTPQTIEEKIICYADKFFSKSSADLAVPKPLEKVKKSILKHGENKWLVFEEMMEMFGTGLVYFP